VHLRPAVVVTAASPAFKRIVRQSAQGLVLKPLLHAYLYEAKFPDRFDVTFHKAGQPRRPDGWFHPSTHPTMDARQLYYYLTDPDGWEAERLSYESRMAVTMGSAVHGFIEACIRFGGWFVPLEGDCPACGRPHGTGEGQCDEYGAADPAVGSRGHMDGVLDIPGWGRGVFEFKCLAPETRISMADGSLLPASAVAAGDMILGWDEETDTLAPRAVQQIWDNGTVPVWTVETREGRRVAVTDEHPFWTRRGWVFAKELVAGDLVKVGGGSNWIKTPVGYDLDEARFLGVMVGDGSLTSQRSSFKVSVADTGILDSVRRYAASVGCDVNYEGRGVDYHFSRSDKSRPNQINALIKREGMVGSTSWTKHVPPSVWTAGPDAWIAFLSGYFDADGTVVTRGSYPHISWASVNRPLLEECQILLGYLDVRASIMRVRGRYKGQEHISWRLLIRDAIAVMRVQKILKLESAKAIALAAMVLKQPKPHHLTAVQGWEKIKQVSEGLARPTIAIEVEGGVHVTEGIVTHNTGGRAEFISDLDLDWFKENHAVYYAQVQEYLRMSGYGKAIVLFASLSYPWKLTEIHVPYDHGFAQQTVEKFELVRAHVAMGTPPDPCCALKSAKAKACPALSCPVKAIR